MSRPAGSSTSPWLPALHQGVLQDLDTMATERGFDTSLTAGGMLALIEGAWRAVPAIEELAVAETWVGFRPGSRDDAPMLGPSGIDQFVVATGHHRNGILLTPITGEVISSYVLTGRLPEAVLPFAPDRFRDPHRLPPPRSEPAVASEV